MPGHVLCAVVNITHLTKKMVGKGLMRMHKLFHEVLCTLLGDQEIPPCFISGLDSLHGNGSKTGYSFESEPLNRDFLMKFRVLVVNAVDKELILIREKYPKNWLK